MLDFTSFEQQALNLTSAHLLRTGDSVFRNEPPISQVVNVCMSKQPPFVGVKNKYV